MNDEYPIVVNRSPRMIVKIGSKTLITRSILHTRDNDGNDTNIIYILAGNNVWQKDGFFTHRNYIQEVAIRMFTQQDINDEQIEFLERTFHENPWLDYERRRDLAKKLETTEQRIRVSYRFI